MKTGKQLILISIIAFIFGSCVSQREFNDKIGSIEKENERLRNEKMELSTANTELSGKNSQLESRLKELEKQRDDAEYQLNVQKENAAGLQREIKAIQKQMDALNSGSSEEIENLLTTLNSTRDDLNAREDKLRTAEKELEERNARLIELQNVLAQKDKAVQDLKKKVMDALTGFHNNGLTVHEKNGKVYVSLDEKLLFKTGKWDVDPKGQQAIRQLGNVLAENPDINIMVEGHTDNVPMHGSGEVKDNWDLSVMRATAVTKILTENKQIEPVRIIAAGRSEYLPLSSDDTVEGRQMNRRTEIILTPKLDELLKIIDME
jgi:chemotaxis protein MotB